MAAGRTKSRRLVSAFGVPGFLETFISKPKRAQTATRSPGNNTIGPNLQGLIDDALHLNPKPLTPIALAALSQVPKP